MLQQSDTQISMRNQNYVTVIIAEYSFEIRKRFPPSSSSKHIRFHISISTTITGLQRNVYKIIVGNNIATRRKFIPQHVDIGVGQRCHAAFDQLSRVSTLYEWKSYSARSLINRGAGQNNVHLNQGREDNSSKIRDMA